jgi:hypothetical protein
VPSTINQLPIGNVLHWKNVHAVLSPLFSDRERERKKKTEIVLALQPPVKKLGNDELEEEKKKRKRKKKRMILLSREEMVPISYYPIVRIMSNTFPSKPVYLHSRTFKFLICFKEYLCMYFIQFNINKFDQVCNLSQYLG